MDVSVLHRSIRIHNALWECFEREQGADLFLDGNKYHVQYLSTTRQHCARVVIDGIVWASQNMHKTNSPFTKRVEEDKTCKITWAFRHRNGTGLKWLQRVESFDFAGNRLATVWDLHPEKPSGGNEFIDEWEFPCTNEVSNADLLFLDLVQSA